ncbi:DUF1433 domain-containing protein [Sporolactobacillus shoreae]|nr:DUF1433 domain-containing protein [Sporolactobacillus shoreae]
MKHTDQENEKKAFISKQEKRITEFFKYNVPTFKSITFSGNQTFPTGSVSIDGYINHDKKLAFSATISPAAGEKNFEFQGGETDALGKLYRKDMKSVSEIEKINKSKSNGSSGQY